MKRWAITFCVISLVGCATKQYPQTPKLSQTEINSLDCKGVDTEISKAYSIQDEINETGSFDGRTVLGFLGDFGIGNGMAKSDAEKKIEDRLHQLELIKPIKCKYK